MRAFRDDSLSRQTNYADVVVVLVVAAGDPATAPGLLINPAAISRLIVINASSFDEALVRTELQCCV
jgi:hypothetical protein